MSGSGDGNADHYMSPEQAYGRTKNWMLDRISTVSVPCVFTVLTNERSVDGKSSIDVVNVRKGVLRNIESLAPHAQAAGLPLCRKR